MFIINTENQSPLYKQDVTAASQTVTQTIKNDFWEALQYI